MWLSTARYSAAVSVLRERFSTADSDTLGLLIAVGASPASTSVSPETIWSYLEVKVHLRENKGDVRPDSAAPRTRNQQVTVV